MTSRRRSASNCTPFCYARPTSEYLGLSGGTRLRDIVKEDVGGATFHTRTPSRLGEAT